MQLGEEYLPKVHSEVMKVSTVLLFGNIQVQTVATRGIDNNH